MDNTQRTKNPWLRSHGTEIVRGLEDVPRSSLYEGRFGRLFRELPPLQATDDELIALAATMVEENFDESNQAGEEKADNPEISAGYTYLGQFIDHDITFDPNSKLQRQNDPNALRNFRTPRFDLDSVYGAGPADQPYIYQDDGMHLLVGINRLPDGTTEEDLPRNNPLSTSAGDQPARALTGDPRNDENLIVSQLHLAMIKYHNAVINTIQNDSAFSAFSDGDKFDYARQIVRWHYQWVVIHDFLEAVVGTEVVDDILVTHNRGNHHIDEKADSFVVFGGRDGGRSQAQAVQRPKANLKFFQWKNQPFIPVEFSVAAYRFGHSMVRGDYKLNRAQDDDLPIFSTDGEDLRGFRRRPPERVIEWDLFFEFPSSGDELQQSRKIDTKLAFGLSTLPPNIVAPIDIHKALAERNLLRGKALDLPSGQDVARAMGLEELVLREGDFDFELKPQGTLSYRDVGTATERLKKSTPLWYYILREAEIMCGGHRLGPVGGRLVAEVFAGLLTGDPFSFFNLQPNWKPDDRFGAHGGSFEITDLIDFGRRGSATGMRD